MVLLIPSSGFKFTDRVQTDKHFTSLKKLFIVIVLVWPRVTSGCLHRMEILMLDSHALHSLKSKPLFFRISGFLSLSLGVVLEVSLGDCGSISMPLNVSGYL